ncbi:MAG TPA: polyamine ABC transporter substrate-binding protein [Woeseiaceae bacterium]|nr:polyamine ABC transporter substrate-binding protein [Woeseiaceae bacterium]
MTITSRLPQSALRAMLLATACALLLPACTGGDSGQKGGPNVVNVYNWADYLAPDTLAKFEAETGIRVNYDIYDSSEVVDVKLLTGNSGYDVVVHSYQFSARLAPIGIYLPIDYSRLTNIGNLDPEVMSQIDVYANVRGYTVPYHWGTTGYAYNEKLVRERLPDHPMDSADVLFDPKIVSKLADCGVSLLDGPTDLFPMVLTYLGLDPNSTDPDDLAIAEAQLKSVRPYILYFSNQKMISDLPNREVCVAMSWSGDYAQAQARATAAGIDIDLRYTVPKEGSRLWVDGFFIPADAPHVDNAYRFIDFMTRADIAAANANEVFYANANAASWPLINPEILNNPAIFPDKEVWKRLFPMNPVDPKEERPRTRAFARVKSGL